MVEVNHMWSYSSILGKFSVIHDFKRLAFVLALFVLGDPYLGLAFGLIVAVGEGLVLGAGNGRGSYSTWGCGYYD